MQISEIHIHQNYAGEPSQRKNYEKPSATVKLVVLNSNVEFKLWNSTG